MNSVTVGGVTLSRELVEQAYALLHQKASDYVALTPEQIADLEESVPTMTVPDRVLSEREARDFARRTCSGADIPIRKKCQHCHVEFVTCLFGGLISPRFCTKACLEVVFPPTTAVHVHRSEAWRWEKKEGRLMSQKHLDNREGVMSRGHKYRAVATWVDGIKFPQERAICRQR